jgi:hypothetical protein
VGALLALITTAPWMENAPTTHATMMVPPQTVTPRPEMNLHIERHHACHGGHQAQAHARHPTTEQEAAPWRSKLIGKQVATTIQPHEQSWHEPTLEIERILMMDFVSTQAQLKEVAPPASQEEGQAEATIAEPLSASPPLTADGVDKMYHQLAETHTIIVAQLAECEHWRLIDATPSPTRAKAGCDAIHDEASTITPY